MRKTFCDVCGKELISGDYHYFDDFDTCSDCNKIIENHYELWEEVKLDTFREFASDLKKSAAAKKSAAKEPVAVKTTCCGKCRQHKHELVTAAEPAAKPAAKLAAKKPVAKPAAKPAAKKPAAKLITTSELAKEIGRKPNIVQCYAYRNKLGHTDKTRRVRLYNQEDADRICKHFEK